MGRGMISGSFSLGRLRRRFAPQGKRSGGARVIKKLSAKGLSNALFGHDSRKLDESSGGFGPTRWIFGVTQDKREV
jgi:hypothetical protein